MPVQTSKFGRPLPVKRRRNTLEEVQPQAGLHTGLPPQSLPPGFSPALQNIIADRNGRVRQRPGLQPFGAFSFNSYTLGAKEVFDKNGKLAGFAPSTLSFSYMHPDNQVWSDLSYLPGTVASAMTGPPSGISTDYWSTEAVWVPSIEAVIAVTSNNTNATQWFEVDGSTTTHSDFTWLDSIASTKAAAAVTAVNDRLVFFNILSSSGTRFPNRVLWSVRGNPIDYTINSGAGFEDLKDMRGYGQAAVRHKDILILFTDQEMWRAIPTLDAFAFRFERVADSFGCTFPQTIAETPEGAVFLGKDMEVYLTTGTQIAPLGPVQGQGASRIQKLLEDELVNPTKAFGVYNQTERQYELYYSTASATEGFCNKALFYKLDNQTWWTQSFPFSFSAGLDLEDPADLTTWDGFSGTWDAALGTWDSYAQTQGSRSVNLFNTALATHRFRSTTDTDGGTAIDCRWRSPGLKQADNGAFSNIHELYLDYETASNSSVSIFLSDDFGDTFDSGYAVSLVTTKRKVFAPVWGLAHNPQFELRWNDGGSQQLSRFQAKLRSSSNFEGAL